LRCGYTSEGSEYAGMNVEIQLMQMQNIFDPQLVSFEGMCNLKTETKRALCPFITTAFLSTFGGHRAQNVRATYTDNIKAGLNRGSAMQQ